MADRTKLVQELASLETPDWFAVLDEAKNVRRDRLRNELDDQDPRPGMSRDQFAQWIARRHVAADPGISDVLFLPTNSPPDEVRLLEINNLLSVPDELGPIEPFDFGPDIPGLTFMVLVADITPDQWKAVQSNRLALPVGWALDGCRKIGHQG